MANIKSSQKKDRQRIKREARNQARKSAMRTAVKKVRSAVGSKNAAVAKDALGEAVRLMDRAASRGTIKPRTASRSVSRLVVAVNALKA
ncbi:MAG: 30S ribosomal protein S20 [Myxococcales bacterium]